MERRTRQRDAIWEFIQMADRPLSPQELLDGAQRSIPRLGIATVYRSIKSLVQEGKLVPVPIPGEPDRYERAGLKHHHHFYCKRCGKVFEMDGCVLQDDFLAPKGFAVEDHEVTLYGTCPRCKV